VKPSTKLSSAGLLRAYQEDAERKRDLIRRANAAKDRLMLITEALRRLARDSEFMGLLDTEGLNTMPEKIAERLQMERAA
jgi:ParB family chromosome partitioning protein